MNTFSRFLMRRDVEDKMLSYEQIQFHRGPYEKPSKPIGVFRSDRPPI
jgi:hypothetical protein